MNDIDLKNLNWYKVLGAILPGGSAGLMLAFSSLTGKEPSLDDVDRANRLIELLVEIATNGDFLMIAVVIFFTWLGWQFGGKAKTSASPVQSVKIKQQDKENLILANKIESMQKELDSLKQTKEGKP